MKKSYVTVSVIKLKQCYESEHTTTSSTSTTISQDEDFP